MEREILVHTVIVHESAKMNPTCEFLMMHTMIPISHFSRKRLLHSLISFSIFFTHLLSIIFSFWPKKKKKHFYMNSLEFDVIAMHNSYFYFFFFVEQCIILIYMSCERCLRMKIRFYFILITSFDASYWKSNPWESSLRPIFPE